MCKFTLPTSILSFGMHQFHYTTIPCCAATAHAERMHRSSRYLFANFDCSNFQLQCYYIHTCRKIFHSEVPIERLTPLSSPQTPGTTTPAKFSAPPESWFPHQ